MIFVGQVRPSNLEKIITTRLGWAKWIRRFFALPHVALTWLTSSVGGGLDFVHKSSPKKPTNTSPIWKSLQVQHSGTGSMCDLPTFSRKHQLNVPRTQWSPSFFGGVDLNYRFMGPPNLPPHVGFVGKYLPFVPWDSVNGKTHHRSSDLKNQGMIFMSSWITVYYCWWLKSG